MKKICLIAALFVSFNLAGQNFRFGINLDPVISWFSPDSKPIDKDGAKLGFNGGLIIETNFQKNYIFATGINLAYLGGNLLYDSAVIIKVKDATAAALQPGTTVEYNLQYISIPLSLKMKTNQIGYISYYGQLGLTPQVNIKARAKSQGGLLDKDNVIEEIGIFNLSYFIGGGIEYSLGGTTALNVGIFFNNGFIDLLDNEEYKAAMNFFNLRLGIMF
ncbi:MAG: PorT family protein [Bacteroidales bacterium]|nr:PorT family protein [Bacteroidales bacterium]MBN2764064.1 PorT family protein [Bacteroidales bacterium]